MALAVLLTDTDVQRLVAEVKVLPPTWRRSLKPKVIKGLGDGHRRGSLELPGEAGNHFAVHVRVKRRHPLDFSVILDVRMPNGAWFPLRRYNGLHKGGHRNVIERERIVDFHIHIPTERYQRRGRPDGYAIRSTQFRNHRTALDCMLQDCGFVEPATGAQMRLPGLSAF